MSNQERLRELARATHKAHIEAIRLKYRHWGDKRAVFIKLPSSLKGGLN